MIYSIESLNQDDLTNKPGSNGGEFRRPAVDISTTTRPKKTLNSKKVAAAANNNNVDGIVRNISALPITGVFDHTNRPGTIQWKTPKLVTDGQRNNINSQDVVLGPIYRLPLDSDDTGAQVLMHWAYAHLKIRLKN